MANSATEHLNLGLAKAGLQHVSDIDSTEPNAVLGKPVYWEAVDFVLSAEKWACARHRVLLTPVLNDHDRYLHKYTISSDPRVLRVHYLDPHAVFERFGTFIYCDVPPPLYVVGTVTIVSPRDLSPYVSLLITNRTAKGLVLARSKDANAIALLDQEYNRELKDAIALNRKELKHEIREPQLWDSRASIL